MRPHGIALDREGNVFVTDASRHKLLKFRADGTFVKEWQGTNFPFYGPRDIAFDAEGRLYIVDQGRTRIVRFNPETEDFFAWGTPGSGDGEFTQPTGIAVDGGEVYVTDTGNDRVQIFDLDGNFIRQWPVVQWGKDDQTFPDIAFDGITKRLYVSSGKTTEILVFDVEGRSIPSVKPVAPYVLNNPSSLFITNGPNGNRLLVLNSGSDIPITGNPSVAIIELGDASEK